MFLRYRQTPNTLKRVKAHAVGREHQLLLLCVLFEFWRISRTRMQANAFYLYVFCLFYSFIGTMLFVNRMQIYDFFLETQCVSMLFYASRTQSGTACTFRQQNALRVNVPLADTSKTSVCTHKLRPAHLVRLSGRLDRNHSVLIGQRSEIKQQRIICND